jgi:putative DNA-invertase from lambdoid prophage Rac
MTTFAYCRVSTAKQAEDGDSLGVQQRQIEGYCQMHGFEAPQLIVEEGVSGSKPLNDRPAGKALLAALRSGDVIVASKLDRMFRSAIDALTMIEEFKRRKISVHLIDLGGDVAGNGISKLVFTILSAVAEAERDRIRSRVKETKADQRKRGRHLGGSRPFGYIIVEDGKGGKLVPDAREQAAIARMRKMRAGKASLRTIAEAMKAEGFTVSHVAVAQALRREDAEGR